MRFRQPATTPEEGDPFQIPAMVDVVFILLAFFVLAAQIVQPEHDLAMQPPPLSDQARAAILPEDLPDRVVITLLADPEGVAIQIGQARLRHNDFDGVRLRLETINLPDTPVVILGDPDLTVEQVTQVLDAVVASPMREVTLSRLPGTGESSVDAAMH